MDLGTFQIPIIFIAVFLIASIILSLVYKYGMKEKTYEEALAEQRSNTQSLLGYKQKPKDKKNKKSTKKTKEAEPDKKKSSINQEVKVNSKTEKNVTDESNLKQKEDSKVKHIANKVIQKDNDDSENFTPNVIFPEDSNKEKPVSLKKIEPSNNANKQKTIPKKEQPKTETVKEKPVNVKKEVTKKEPTDKHKVDPAKDKQIVDVDEIKHPAKTLKKDSPNPGHTSEVEIVNKKEELKVMNKVEEPNVVDAPIPIHNKPSKSNLVVQNSEGKLEIAEKVTYVSKLPLANGYVVNPSKDKRKKKELNALQQLTAASGGPGMSFIQNMVNNAELSHADIQILINQLLNKQLDAPKILDDWSEGKYDPVQKLKKQLAEKEKALLDEQETLAGVQIKLKEVRNEQLTERTSLNHKIKILEEQLQNQQMDLLACNNTCHAQGQQLQQTQAQLHSLRDELTATQMQRQQLEMHIAQESEVIIAQLRGDVQEYSARNEQMLIDINTIQKVAAENEASYIAQLSNMTQELGEKSRQLEELHHELATKNEMLYRQEGELKTEIAQLNAVMQQQAEEMRKTEQSYEEILEEVNNLKKQKTISNKVIAQLKGEIEEYKKQQQTSMENNKINETEVLNWKNELACAKSLSEELRSDVDSKLNVISQLETELEEQKTKNNDLRNKNYKIMEALNAAELRIKTVQEENSDKEKKSSEEEKTNKIDSQKKLLSRLLPAVNGLEEIPSERWEEECSKLVSNYLETQKKLASNESTEKLQAKIDQYQSVIKDTEEMLAKLQVHVDQEQISWKAQIKVKDLELAALKEKLEKSQNIEAINGSSTEEQ